MAQYKDSFKDFHTSFWNVIEQEKGITVDAKNKLVLKGKTSDSVWEPSGLVSKAFNLRNLNVSVPLKSKNNNSFLVIGLVDETGRSIGISLTDKYWQLYESGERARNIVPSVKVKDPARTHLIHLESHAQGNTQVFLDSMKLDEHETELKGDVRVFILSDSPNKDAVNNVIVDSIDIRNK